MSILAHELGHYFSLPHTYHGWANYLYDTTRTTPTHIGIHEVEKVDGSNCETAGDGFCDTSPDYLSFGWDCDSDSMSLFQLEDPDGEKFYADGRNIMSASSRPNSLSEEQVAFIKYIIQDKRNIDISEPAIPEIIEKDITIISSIINEVVPANSVVFAWEPVEGAFGYLLEYTPFPTFSSLSTKIYVEEPFFIPEENLSRWVNYIWRVKPLSLRTFCTPHSETYQFQTTDVTSVKNAYSDVNYTLYPNPISQNDGLHIVAKNGVKGDLLFKVYSTTGELLIETRKAASGHKEFNLDISSLQAGGYFVQIITADGQSLHKIMVVD